MDEANGMSEQSRCPTCGYSPGYLRRWTKQAVIDAIQDWADEHGGIPPTSRQWHVSRGADVPSEKVVRRLFGKWSTAIEAAGFLPHQIPEHDPMVRQRAEAMWDEKNIPLVEIARRLDLPSTTVQYWAKHRWKKRDRYCAQCGEKLKQCGRGRPRRFCEQCRSSRNSAEPQLKHCIRCDEPFLTNRSNRRFCSDICRKKHWDETPVPCSNCGRPHDRKTSLCEECSRAFIARAKRLRAEDIAALWREGRTLQEIANLLGTTKGAVGVAVVKLRAEGWDLPYRRGEDDRSRRANRKSSPERKADT